MKKNSKFWIYTFVVIGTFLMLAGSCKKSDDNPSEKTSSGTVKDIDGNVYHTVTIGTQVWMVENLKTTKYRDGSPIPNITDYSEWSNLANGAYCNYNNNVAIGDKYGKLYNWYAANDSRNIAPTGWHVPTDDEWTTLEKYVKANIGTSGSVAKPLAAKTDWDTQTEKGPITMVGAIGNDLTKNNDSGFTALPAGFRCEFQDFSDIGYDCYWWCSGSTYYRSLYCHSDYLHSSYEANRYKWVGYSIRCIKD